MQKEYKRYYRLYVRPSFLLVCNDGKKHTSLIRHAKARTRTKEGQLSEQSRRKIKSAIRWLIACSDFKLVYEKKAKRKVKWKINMITLTFHENFQNDSMARQILSRWIEMAKYRFDMIHYLWKAEPQERGAIHFHLTTNVYIPHTELRFTWNRELMKHGLSSAEDNSTDVHAVTNCRSHENYLADYFLNEEKHQGRRAITGKLWGCSHGLSQAGKAFLSIDEHEANMMQKEEWKDSLYKKYLDEGKEIPDFLKFTDIYLTGLPHYKNLPECAVKKLYFDEIAKLKSGKRQKEFWNEEK